MSLAHERGMASCSEADSGSYEAALLRCLFASPSVPQGDPLLTPEKSSVKPLYTAALEQLNGAMTPALPEKFKSVDTVHASQLSEAEFLIKYMVTNTPVLIKGALATWRSVHDWVSPEGLPQVSKLEELAGRDAPVPVTDTSRQRERVGACEEVTLGQYLDWWRGDRQDIEGLPRGHWYLKDWHFVAQVPDYEAYTVPEYMKSDWLNDHYDMLAARQRRKQKQDQASTATCSDYRFVYLGPAGSWTPLHSDVLRSYSWSANIAGRKRWRLLPPQYTYLVYDPTLSTSSPDWGLQDCYTHVHDPDTPDNAFSQAQCQPLDTRLNTSPFPALPATQSLLYEVIQEPGELLFVPSGWHHTVVNLTDTLSINHNWFNAHNIHWCWSLVKTTHLRAAHSLLDCRRDCEAEEWWQLVQKIVAADCGLDLQGLAHLCAGVITRALSVLGLEHWSERRKTVTLDPIDDHVDGQIGPAGHEIGGGKGPAQAEALLDVRRAMGVLCEIVQVIQSGSGVGDGSLCTSSADDRPYAAEKLCDLVAGSSCFGCVHAIERLCVLATEAVQHQSRMRDTG